MSAVQVISFVHAALNEKLKEEVNRLKLEVRQVAANGNGLSRALPPQIPTRRTSFHQFGNQQMAQARQRQLLMPHSTTGNHSQTRMQSSFSDVSQRI